MAYRDENGKITIDEVVAQQDIRNLNKAKENLSTALEYLKEIIELVSDFSGNTGTVINETTLQLQKQVHSAIDNIDTTSNNINSTVKKYQAIDETLKNIINGTI